MTTETINGEVELYHEDVSLLATYEVEQCNWSESRPDWGSEDLSENKLISFEFADVTDENGHCVLTESEKVLFEKLLIDKLVDEGVL